jgi:hypothetical protein
VDDAPVQHMHQDKKGTRTKHYLVLAEQDLHTIALYNMPVSTQVVLMLLLLVHFVEGLPLEQRYRSKDSRGTNPTGLVQQCLQVTGNGHLQYDNDDDDTTSRRKVLQKMTTAATSALLFLPPVSLAVAFPPSTSPTTTPATITTPLEYVPALNAYVVHFYLFGERFGAIVDTGSPFLTVPSTCNKWAYKYKWGCYKPELTMDSGYSNTVEGFDNNQGTVVWRKAPFSFDNNSQQGQPPIVFGVFGPALLDGPGGVFLGLIKETDAWIRPSFMGQTGYQSFCVDLRRHNQQDDNNEEMDGPKLILSQHPMISSDDDNYIPLVRDLKRRYKAPVVHYTAKVSSFVVNGLPLKLSDAKRPTYVIFDTGVTGMVVSQELFDGRYLQARKNREKSVWGQVTVTFTTMAGTEIQLMATKPITTPLGKATPWPRFKGNLIVLGLAFLDGLAVTIDIEQGKLQFRE